MMEKEIVEQLQDYALLQSSLLTILEAVETKKWPKTFYVFNSQWNDETLSAIARAFEKIGVEVPESEK